MNETLKAEIVGILTATFPEYHIQFEAIDDDPNLVGLGVYGVQKHLVKWVKSQIHRLDERFCADFGYVLLPLVRDMETTRNHYPHLLKVWRYAAHCYIGRVTDSVCDETLNAYGPRLNEGEWQGASRGPSFNEELELAA